MLSLTSNKEAKLMPELRDVRCQACDKECSLSTSVPSMQYDTGYSVFQK